MKKKGKKITEGKKLSIVFKIQQKCKLDEKEKERACEKLIQF